MHGLTFSLPTGACLVGGGIFGDFRVSFNCQWLNLDIRPAAVTVAFAVATSNLVIELERESNARNRFCSDK